MTRAPKFCATCVRATMTARRKKPKAALALWAKGRPWRWGDDVPVGWSWHDHVNQLDAVAQLFAYLARLRRELPTDAFLAEFDRLAPPDPVAEQMQAAESREQLCLDLSAHDKLHGQLQQRRKTGLQRSLEARQDRADADARAINAEATRLLATKLAARYIVGTIARTMKRSPSTVRRALAGHSSGLWPGPKTKRARG